MSVTGPKVVLSNGEEIQVSLNPGTSASRDSIKPLNTHSEEIFSHSFDRNEQTASNNCECGPEIYMRLFGPTADEIILSGLQTFFNVSAKLQTCKADNDKSETERDVNTKKKNEKMTSNLRPQNPKAGPKAGSEKPKSYVIKAKYKNPNETRECECSPDLYTRVLGSTADEVLLTGLQTLIDLCGRLKTCEEDDEGPEKESPHTAEKEFPPEKDTFMRTAHTATQAQPKTKTSLTQASKANLLAQESQVDRAHLGNLQAQNTQSDPIHRASQETQAGLATLATLGTQDSRTSLMPLGTQASQATMASQGIQSIDLEGKKGKKGKKPRPSQDNFGQTDLKKIATSGLQANPQTKMGGSQTTVDQDMLKSNSKLLQAAPELETKQQQATLEAEKPKTRLNLSQTSTPSMTGSYMQTDNAATKKTFTQTKATPELLVIKEEPPAALMAEIIPSPDTSRRRIPLQPMDVDDGGKSGKGGKGGKGGNEHNAISPPEPPSSTGRICVCSSGAIQPRRSCSCKSKNKKCRCSHCFKKSSTSFERRSSSEGQKPQEVRYALTKITKYKEFTTYEVMKSTRQEPKKLPKCIEGVFVLKQKK